MEDRDGLSRVYILEGTVECSAGNQTVQVNAGEMAELMADGSLVVRAFTVQDIPVFVQVDVDQEMYSALQIAPAQETAPTPESASTPAYEQEKELVFTSADERNESGMASVTIHTCTFAREIDLDFFLEAQELSGEFAEEGILPDAVREGVIPEDYRFYMIYLYADPSEAVPDGGFSSITELFDRYTGTVLALDTNEDTYSGSGTLFTDLFTVEFNGKEYPIWIEMEQSLSETLYNIIFRVVVPADYDGLGLVLAYSSRDLETQYEALQGTMATLDDYGILDRPDYKLFRVDDIVQ